MAVIVAALFFILFFYLSQSNFCPFLRVFLPFCRSFVLFMISRIIYLAFSVGWISMFRFKMWIAYTVRYILPPLPHVPSVHRLCVNIQHLVKRYPREI